MISLHHTHLLCSNADESISFWCNAFDAEVIRDVEFAGARNVLLQIGGGRIHLYAQPPKHLGQGTAHHLGLQTDDVHATMHRLRSMQVSVTDVRQDPLADYVMAQGPDKLLLEIFQPHPGVLAELGDYFPTG